MVNEENLDKENCLDKLKQKYDKFKSKYDLPEFLELNKFFDIEEVDFDTDFLLRKIRRVISDRIAGYLRFIEIILNPSNAPMFFFKLIKKLEETDKEILSKTYELLGTFEVEIVGLDLNYGEKKEAEFIKKIYTMFTQDISKRLLNVINKLSIEEIEKKEEKRSYFG